jgi:hypothetical protein
VVPASTTGVAGLLGVEGGVAVDVVGDVGVTVGDVGDVGDVGEVDGPFGETCVGGMRAGPVDDGSAPWPPQAARTNITAANNWVR